jgi:hypothetical protein
VLPQKKSESAVLAALLDLRAHAKPAVLPDLRPRVSSGHGADPLDLAALCLALGRRADAIRRIDLGMRDPDNRRLTS